MPRSPHTAPRCRRLAALWRALAWAALIAPSFAWAGVEEDVREVYETPNLQREVEVELPDGWGTLPPTQVPKEPEQAPEEADEPRVSQGAGEIGGILMWILIALTGGAALAALIMRLSNYHPEVKGQGEAEAPPPLPAADLRRDAETEAEALARAGRYGEAIHALLLKTLEALARHRRLRPALTSREILAAIELHPEAQGALAQLVDAVEISLFGGQIPGEQAWRACQASFERFIGAYQRKVAA